LYFKFIWQKFHRHKRQLSNNCCTQAPNIDSGQVGLRKMIYDFSKQLAKAQDRGLWQRHRRSYATRSNSSNLNLNFLTLQISIGIITIHEDFFSNLHSRRFFAVLHIIVKPGFIGLNGNKKKWQFDFHFCVLVSSFSWVIQHPLTIFKTCNISIVFNIV